MIMFEVLKVDCQTQIYNLLSYETNFRVNNY